jgi:hypothetical protein
MQLQEDKCQPGCMQLKVEALAMLGVHGSFFHPSPESFYDSSILCLSSLESFSRTILPFHSTSVFCSLVMHLETSGKNPWTDPSSKLFDLCIVMHFEPSENLRTELRLL